MGVRVVAMATKFGPKNCTHQFSASNREIYRLYDGDFGAVAFQYAIRIFKGAKGVAMATKIEIKKAKIALISVLCKKSRNFAHEKSGFWVGDFKYAITIFKLTKGVAMATKFRKNISQNCTNFCFLQKIEEFFACSVCFYVI